MEEVFENQNDNAAETTKANIFLPKKESVYSCLP